MTHHSAKLVYLSVAQGLRHTAEQDARGITHGTMFVARDGRHPMAILAMVAWVLVGARGFIEPRSPTSTLDRFIPDPWRLDYYGLLLLSGLIFLISVCLRDIRDRLIWERIALLFFAGVLLCYRRAETQRPPRTTSEVTPGCGY